MSAEPARPVLAAPVFKATDPVSALSEVPVDKMIRPEGPSFPASAVIIEIAPVVLAAEKPAARAREPPVAAVLDPAWTSICPP